MLNIVIILILTFIVIGAVWYLINAKKKGNKCIGCPGKCTECQENCQNKRP